MPHDRNLYFNDVNVVLAGTLNKPQLKEYLYSSFRIELHDRQRSHIVHEPPKPCLFGKDPKLDEAISNVNLSASKHTLYNPFDVKDSHWDPYGVATLSLNELILGQKMIELSVPVLPCAAPDVFGRDTNRNGAANRRSIGNDDHPLQPGEYLDSNTQLSLTVWAAKSILGSSKEREATDNTNVNTHCLMASQKRTLNIISDDTVCFLKFDSQSLVLLACFWHFFFFNFECL